MILNSRISETGNTLSMKTTDHEVPYDFEVQTKKWHKYRFIDLSPKNTDQLLERFDKNSKNHAIFA